MNDKAKTGGKKESHRHLSLSLKCVYCQSLNNCGDVPGTKTSGQMEKSGTEKTPG